MLAACRLAGLSALEGYYAGVRVGAQCGADADGLTRRGAGSQALEPPPSVGTSGAAQTPETR
jgi:hypothetical protein